MKKILIPIVLALLAWILLSISDLNSEVLNHGFQIQDSKASYQLLDKKLDHQTDILLEIKEQVGEINGYIKGEKYAP